MLIALTQYCRVTLVRTTLIAMREMTRLRKESQVKVLASETLSLRVMYYPRALTQALPCTSTLDCTKLLKSC